MKIGIFNNYKNHLSEIPKPKGIKNIIGYSDNIGNIVFLESIAREVGADHISMYDFMLNYKIYEEKYDILILSLANMISSSFSLNEKFIKALEEIKTPICIFSVGIQADTESELLEMKMSETSKRILKLSEKSGTTIGLRGSITKDYLDKQGIKNTQVIGCPSIFYKKVIPKKKKNELNNVLLSGSFNGFWQEPLYDIYRFGYKYCNSYLVQSESRILFDKYKISEIDLKDWKIDENRIQYLLDKNYDYYFYCHKEIDKEDLSKWFIDKSIFFTDFDNWLESMYSYNLHLGVRFHGSVMTTLAGVPTLILSGDLRVKEFVDFHRLPNINIFDFNSDLTPERIYDIIDYSEYESLYDELFENYKNFLNKNGLQYIYN